MNAQTSLQASLPPLTLEAHRTRSDKAWSERQLWQKLYDDAYEFAIPYRRPASRMGKAANTVERVFDSTAISGSFRSAGKLKEDLFPTGQSFFRLAPGALTRLAMKANNEDQTEAKQHLQDVSDVISAFFQTGEFDGACTEMCTDLLAGTAALMPWPGDDRNPLRFVCIPFDECAIEIDAFGAVMLLSWKTKFTRRQIFNNFPKGEYPEEFAEALQTKPDDEVEIRQDFFYDPEIRMWRFWAYIDKCERPIVEERYRTQPVAVPRYYRVPGEPYGRGPLLLAMPSIKTLNKAVEIMLKAAAIQMLGIWGWRPGGSFNPDTARIAPGVFWPMTATGGVLGPDVVRMDTGAGRLDVSQLVTKELRLQVQAMLHDDQLPNDAGTTPPSATEIMERVKRIAQNYLGAFGRLVNEIIPVIVRRVIEILYDAKKLPNEIDIDTLLVKIDVLSPIAAALKSQAMSVIIEWLQLVIALKGPQGVEFLAKVDDALREIGLTMGVPPEFIMTRTEQEKLQQLVQQAMQDLVVQQQAQQQQAAAAANAAPGTQPTTPAPIAA